MNILYLNGTLYEQTCITFLRVNAYSMLLCSNNIRGVYSQNETVTQCSFCLCDFEWLKAALLKLLRNNFRYALFSEKYYPIRYM